MKLNSRFLVIGAFASILGILLLSSSGFITQVLANNGQEEKLLKVEYRMTSHNLTQPVEVDYKIGAGEMRNQKITLPWSAEIVIKAKKGDPIALYFMTYTEIPATLTYEIWIDGKIAASQTDDSQYFISNNLSCSVN